MQSLLATTDVTLSALNTILVSDAIPAAGVTKSLTLQAGGNITINADITAVGITLSANNAGGTVTGTGHVITTAALNAAGGTLTITNNGTGGTHQIGAALGGNTLVITGPAQLTGPQSWTLATDTTIAANLSGTGSLQTLGAGVLSLSGNNGSWSGGLSIGTATTSLIGGTNPAGTGAIDVGANRLNINGGVSIGNAVTLNGGTLATRPAPAR